MSTTRHVSPPRFGLQLSATAPPAPLWISGGKPVNPAITQATVAATAVVALVIPTARHTALTGTGLPRWPGRLAC